MDSVIKKKPQSHVQKCDNNKSTDKNLLVKTIPVSLDTIHAQYNDREEAACYGVTGTRDRGGRERDNQLLSLLFLRTRRKTVCPVSISCNMS